MENKKASKKENALASIEQEDEAASLPIDGVSEMKRKNGERKARKLLSKCGLQPVRDVAFVTMRKYGGSLYVINNPDVYKNTHTGQYVFFGEVKSELISDKEQTVAPKKFMFTETSDTPDCDAEKEMATATEESEEESDDDDASS